MVKKKEAPPPIKGQQSLFAAWKKEDPNPPKKAEESKVLKKIEEKEASQPEVKEEAGAAAIILEDDIAEDVPAPAAKALPSPAKPPAPIKEKKDDELKLSDLKRKRDAAAASAVAVAAAAAGAEEEEEEAGEDFDDPIEDEEEEEEEEELLEDDGGGAGPSTAQKKKKRRKVDAFEALKQAQGAGKGASKVSGVGEGTIKLAAEYLTQKVDEKITWKEGEEVPYLFLASVFEDIAEESKRLLITGMLTGALRAVLRGGGGDLLPIVYLCVNRVAPSHEGLELGIGDASLIKALAEATGRKESAIKEDYQKEGDLGKVAALARTSQNTLFKPKPLTIKMVFKTFREIAQTEGTKSQDKKRSLITKLLAASKANEAGYIIRSLQGKLRIGLAEQTVLVALAHAVTLERDITAGKALKKEALADRLEEASQILKQVYSECPSYDLIVPAMIEGGVASLPDKCKFTPGVPIKPMLAKPTTGVQEVLNKFDGREFTCEYKYDGERAQIHIQQGGKVIKIYSRNLEDNTTKYPDIIARIPGSLKPGVEELVLDCEAVGWDRTKKQILPFQILSTRGRKDVSIENVQVQVCVFAFDCLYFNGKSLLREPLTARREAMYSALEEKEGEMMFAVAKTSTDVEELSQFLDDSIKDCTEGLIVKTLNDTYEPSKRSNNWLKLKKDYLDGVGDTIDVVPIGAWLGKGKRTGFYGSFLLAIYNGEEEEFQTISKIGTGFSEDDLDKLSKALTEHLIDAPKKYYRYGESLIPDVWFDAKIVWEIKAADLSISPVHQAGRGLVDPAKGISIRFPRLLRVRDDKNPEDATSAEQIAEMYKSQAVAQANAKPADEDGGWY